MNIINKKILLIEPPFYRLFKETYSLDRYPLALGYLACTIKNRTDWDVMAYNTDFNPLSESIKISHLAGAGFDNYLERLKDISGDIWDEVRSTIKEYNPSVVGISSKSQNFSSACNVAKIAKEIDRNIFVIVGGPHSSMVGPDILNCREIDVSVRGEGEETIVEILEALDSNADFQGIDGTYYRKDGEIIENPPRKFIQDLDTLCFPHESASEILRDYHKYPLMAFKYIFAVRGCPNNCFFCGSHKIWSRKVRFHSTGNVITEIKKLQEKGLHSIHFDDDTFGISKKHIRQLCEAIMNECRRLSWSCEMHVKLVDDQTIALMRNAGCYEMQLGIESGNNDILREMRKNITIEEAFEAAKIIKKHGITVQAFFMVGFPRETEETLNDTLRAMKAISADVIAYSIFTPYPGTEIFEYCRDLGLVDNSFDVSLYNHQSPANCFSKNISPERFRQLAANIEKLVDRKNSINRIRKMFSLNALNAVRELGFRRSVRKGLQILMGK